MPVPGFALKAMYGEMAEALLLTGVRAVPAKAQAHGYHFRYPEIDIAMRGIFGE
jgi:NAD dependent epimerase/dehydratase family enzyme